MMLTYTQEQEALATMLRSVFAAHCPTTLIRELKNSESFPEDLWTTLSEAGVFGICLDSEYGGAGASLFELGIVFEEAGRVLCPNIVLSTLEFAVALDRLGSEEQKIGYLKPLVSGRLKASLAAWNPGNAADVRPCVSADHADSDDTWRLTGTLMFVPDGLSADVIMVTARAPAPFEPSRVFGFLIEPNGDGVSIQKQNMLGDGRYSKVLLDGYRVPNAAVIRGSAGGGVADADLHWIANASVALQCMDMVGGARAVLDRTVEYIKAREVFGRPISAFQAAQHHIANMRIAVEGARLAACQAVWRVGQGELAQRDVALAKMHCSETYKWNTLTAHQLHGGMGYVRETDLHLWSERAKVAELRGGTADVAANWLELELGLLQ